MSHTRSERSEHHDDKTSARVLQLTDTPCINHPLYYLANSFSPDSSQLVFASNRSGRYALYTVRLDSGHIDELSDVEGVYPFSGNVIGEHVYFTTERGSVFRTSLTDRQTDEVASKPGCGLGEVTINTTGDLGCCLVTDEGKAGLLVFQTDGTDASVILDGARALYHPQFHPTNRAQEGFVDEPHRSSDPSMRTVHRRGSGGSAE